MSPPAERTHRPAITRRVLRKRALVADEVCRFRVLEHIDEIHLDAIEHAPALHEPAELTVVDVVEAVRKPEGLDDAHARRDAGTAAADQVPTVVRGAARRGGQAAAEDPVLAGGDEPGAAGELGLELFVVPE